MTKKLTEAERAANEARRAANREAWRAGNFQRDLKIIERCSDAERRRNKLAWALDARNANYQRGEMLSAVAPEIPEEVTDDISPLDQLRAIMLDGDEPLYRRVDAAEAVIGFELAPASLVNLPPDQVAAGGSFKFLSAVASAAQTPAALKLRCLKAVAAIQHARASRADPTQQAEKRKLQRRLGETAPAMPADMQWPPTDIARKLDEAKRRRMAK